MFFIDDKDEKDSGTPPRKGKLLKFFSISFLINFSGFIPADRFHTCRGHHGRNDSSSRFYAHINEIKR
jgi:hypothetical protein